MAFSRAPGVHPSSPQEQVAGNLIGRLLVGSRTAAHACGRGRATTNAQPVCKPRMATHAMQSQGQPTTFLYSCPILDHPSSARHHLSAMQSLRSRGPRPSQPPPSPRSWRGRMATRASSLARLRRVSAWPPALSAYLHGRFCSRLCFPFAAPCFAAATGGGLPAGGSSLPGPCAAVSFSRSAGLDALLSPRFTAVTASS